MLKLFKKRSSKTSSSSDTPSSLWSYGQPPPDYDQTQNLFFNTPIDELPSAPEEPFKVYTFDVSGSLEIITKMDIKSTGVILNILEEFLDHYNGSSVYKSIILGNALMLGFHLSRKQRNESMYDYSSEIYFPIEYNVSPNYDVPEGKLNYAFSHRFKRGKQDIFLNFSVSLKKTNKKGVKFLNLYNNPMSNNSNPPYIGEAMDHLQLPYKWEEDEIVFQ
ncbi:matrix [Landjia virus]|uniref:Matrix protein n=1 Tax=Landjia virus TaxID=1272947 RepID=A0A0D3R1F1_9RHAB|nr:matrix [Landjia virus]AJR28483.1 matrix [Landjia virus]